MTRFAYAIFGDPPVWAGQRFAIKRMRDLISQHREHAMFNRPVGWPLDRRYSVRVSAFVRLERGRDDIADLGKFVLDALQGVVFTNDAQVASLLVERAIDDREPRTYVQIAVMEGA